MPVHVGMYEEMMLHPGRKSRAFQMLGISFFSRLVIVVMHPAAPLFVTALSISMCPLSRQPCRWPL